VNELRRLLPRSWAAFLGRFPRPSPIQCDAIPRILEGGDVLITAPTASGKTEAFATPAVELILAGERGSCRVVVVSPTRALANDLSRRLESRFDEVGVSFGRYTGEHKKLLDGRLPELTITTPESLDSLLARRPAALARVRMVVLDEIHVVDGSPRGDQIRVLLHRLERAARHRPQRIAVSATVDDPVTTASSYLVDAAIVQSGTPRRVHAKAFHGHGAVAMAKHLRTLADGGFRKILVFTNRRYAVELYSTRLKGHCVFDQNVFPHHGSLSRSSRERTERRFLEAPAAVAFATMTLELGIDIGSVDYVLLAERPPDVASLLQRLGRGGRRGDSSRVGYVLRDGADEIVYPVLFAHGIRGRLLEAPYAFRPGVLVQQALVIAGAEGWIDAARLENAVPAAIWKDLAPTKPEEILGNLERSGLLEASKGRRWVLSETSENKYERGVLHSNIQDDLTDDVVDRLTGEIIGKVEAADHMDFDLGGGGRKPILHRQGRLLTDATRPGGIAVFAPRGSPCCSLDQGRAVVERSGVGKDEIGWLPSETSTIILHGLGTVGSLFLTKALGETHGQGYVESASPYALRVVGRLTELPERTPAAIESFAKKWSKKLAKLCGMGPWHRQLPESLQARAVRRAADLARLGKFLETARLAEVSDDDGALAKRARDL
jgi:ATP-dependent Lhr-like helicase